MPNHSLNDIPSEKIGSAMRIKSIRIKNFKSYADAELNCSSFNILVGRNNHGKSNFIEAVEWFYNGQAPLDQIRHTNSLESEQTEVEIVFFGVKEGLEEISNETNKSKIRNIIGEADEMKVKRVSENAPKRQIFNPTTNEWQVQPCGADSTFNNCFPRFEFVQTTKNLREVAAYKSSSPIGQLLNGLLDSVLNKNASAEYQDFLAKFAAIFGEPDPFTGEKSAVRKALDQIGNNVKDHLESQFPDCRDVSFNIAPPEPDDLLKGYQTTLDDGVITSAEEKGDGMQRALMLAIIKAHADLRRTDDVGRSFVFFIDEAELHLHPTAQRQLKESLFELSQDQDQVFLTTHSSVFIADRPDEQTLFSVTKDNGVTNIVNVVDQADLQDLVFDLLGGHPADLLLPPNFLIVEGKSEDIFLHGVIKRFYGERPNIKIVTAHGDDNAVGNQYDSIQKMLSINDGRAVYGDKLTILLDKPDPKKQARFQKFKADNPDLVSTKRLYVLPTESLEQYYPASLAASCNKSSKVKKAEWMAKNISQTLFETEMTVIFESLEKCWEGAFVTD